MNINDKIIELKFVIGRFDHYYDSVNNKGNLYLAINTFLFGGAIAGYNSLDKVHHFISWIVVLFLIPFLLCNITSFAYTLSAIRPFTRKHRASQSMLFFADVSQLQEIPWKNRWQQLTYEQWKDDLLIQTHLLATGLQRKFENLSCATLFIGVQVGLFFIFSVFYFVTYKI